jgi:hypothetical protein
MLPKNTEVGGGGWALNANELLHNFQKDRHQVSNSNVDQGQFYQSLNKLPLRKIKINIQMTEIMSTRKIFFFLSFFLFLHDKGDDQPDNNARDAENLITHMEGVD